MADTIEKVKLIDREAARESEDREAEAAVAAGGAEPLPARVRPRTSY